MSWEQPLADGVPSRDWRCQLAFPAGQVMEKTGRGLGLEGSRQPHTVPAAAPLHRLLLPPEPPFPFAQLPPTLPWLENHFLEKPAHCPSEGGPQDPSLVAPCTAPAYTLHRCHWLSFWVWMCGDDFHPHIPWMWILGLPTSAWHWAAFSKTRWNEWFTCFLQTRHSVVAQHSSSGSS